jgi:hypothetical protein
LVFNEVQNYLGADLDLRTILPTTLPSLLNDVQTSSPEEGTKGQGGSPSDDEPDSEEEFCY